MDKKFCQGCVDNFYNKPGNSPIGECFSLASAVREPRFLIHVDAMPPYTKERGHEPQLTPVCYKRERHVNVKPEAITSKGFWKF